VLPPLYFRRVVGTTIPVSAVLQQAEVGFVDANHPVAVDNNMHDPGAGAGAASPPLQQRPR
jgi:hypothetical protein